MNSSCKIANLGEFFQQIWKDEVMNFVDTNLYGENVGAKNSPKLETVEFEMYGEVTRNRLFRYNPLYSQQVFLHVLLEGVSKKYFKNSYTAYSPSTKSR